MIRPIPKDIAVYTSQLGEVASLYEPGKIMVYHKDFSNWKVTREKDFCLDKTLGLKGLRISMTEAIKFLDDCKIFAGLSVTGVPYFELEKANCSIWEFEGKPESFLDYILEQEDQAQLQKAQRSDQIPMPVEIRDGCYQISLKDIQVNNSGVTTKQVLLPFLRSKRFYSLEVVCNHIPPWLETELMAVSFATEVNKVSKDETRLVITRKC